MEFGCRIPTGPHANGPFVLSFVRIENTYTLLEYCRSNDINKTKMNREAKAEQDSTVGYAA